MMPRPHQRLDHVGAAFRHAVRELLHRDHLGHDHVADDLLLTLQGAGGEALALALPAHRGRGCGREPWSSPRQRLDDGQLARAATVVGPWGPPACACGREPHRDPACRRDRDPCRRPHPPRAPAPPAPSPSTIALARGVVADARSVTWRWRRLFGRLLGRPSSWPLPRGRSARPRSGGAPPPRSRASPRARDASASRHRADGWARGAFGASMTTAAASARAASTAAAASSASRVRRCSSWTAECWSADCKARVRASRSACDSTGRRRSATSAARRVPVRPRPRAGRRHRHQPAPHWPPGFSKARWRLTSTVTAFDRP